MVLLLAADDSFTPFLGDDLIVYLVLAMGAALVAGNVAALLRPPERAARDDDGRLERAPVVRSMIWISAREAAPAKGMQPAASRRAASSVFIMVSNF